MISTMVIAVPVGHQDVQLARHAVGRQHPLHGADAERARVRLDVRHRRAVAASSWPRTPVDIYIHDTYFIVAHIHYVRLRRLASSAIFAAIYFWFPKMFGRMMNATLGQDPLLAARSSSSTWTFFPMHILGVGGHMRRIYNPMQYEFLQPMQHWNVFITYRRPLPRRRAAPLRRSTSSGRCSPAARRRRTRGTPTRSSGTAPSPPPHGNFRADAADRLPRPLRVQRRPRSAEDYLPQSQPPARAAARRARPLIGVSAVRLAAPLRRAHGGRDAAC